VLKRRRRKDSISECVIKAATLLGPKILKNGEPLPKAPTGAKPCDPFGNDLDLNRRRFD
jgi:hypothetical protein